MRVFIFIASILICGTCFYRSLYENLPMEDFLMLLFASVASVAFVALVYDDDDDDGSYGSYDD